MVVTKRAPAPPVPTSRTTSAHQIPRARGNASVVASGANDVTSSPTNGTSSNDPNQITELNANNQTGDPPSKKNSKSKPKQKKGSKKTRSTGSRFVDLLSRIFLLWSLIYTLSVCPQDEQLQSPVCRGLSMYRQFIIEPYVLPPIHLALSHPSVAPYVEKARPYTARASHNAKAIARATSYEWNTRIVPQWNKHVVPQWHKRVVPQWNKLVVPLWERHVVPQIQRLDAQVAPYRDRVTGNYDRFVTRYVRQVSPYIIKATETLYHVQNKARPYIVFAVHKTYHGYQKAAPYAQPVWEQIKILFAKLVNVLAEQRRQFVDPHVQKIWEQVKELSSGKPRTSSADLRDSITSQVAKTAESAAYVASSLISTPTPSAHVTSLALDVLEATISPRIPAVAPLSESLSSSVESTSPTSFSLSAADAASTLSSSLHDTASKVVSGLGSSISSGISSLSEAASPLVSVASLAASMSASGAETASVASFVASSLTDKVASSVSELGDAVSAAASQATESATALASSASGAVSEAISQSSPSLSSSAKVASPMISSSVFPLADRASSSVRSASSKTAKKVDEDIDLDAFYAELGLDDVEPEPIVTPSEAAPAPPVQIETEEEITERKRQRTADNAAKRADVLARHAKWEEELAEAIKANTKALRKALVALRKTAAAELKESEEIRAEVESLTDEADKFLRGAEKYVQTLVKEDKTDKEKRVMWDRLMDRVDEKFADRLRETEAVVNGWYAPVLDKELAEVRKVTDAVRDVADRGQADIGMDYAYLDDVTYKDWQRYHNLLRKSSNFTELAHSIQNGSAPSPAVNPVLEEINDLQSEVQDIVLGFETRLRRIRRNGERALIDNSGETDNESIKILPIQDEDKVQSSANIEVPPVVIGRSKEEVMDALSRVVELDDQATSSPQATDESSSVDAIVAELEENQSQPDSAVSAVAHEEL